MADFTKLYDRSDATKWAHPELVDIYTQLCDLDPYMENTIYNFELTHDERFAGVMAMRAQVEGLNEVMADSPGFQGEHYMAPGCPEESEAEVELIVYRPSKPAKGPQRVLYAVGGGGMFMTQVEITALWMLAEDYGCVVVPRYRNAFDAKYPAAINDCHAGYTYVVEHADELGIDPDNIVLFGQSSGSHLALSLAFRLKRFGYRPKGCVVICAFTDCRPIFATSTIRNGGNWNTMTQFGAAVQWLGVNGIAKADTPEKYPNFATPEDCIGLCPIFIHGDTEEGNCGSTRAFADTLSVAGVYHELHNWGGTCHAALMGKYQQGSDDPYSVRYEAVVKGEVQDCWNYDLRRPFIEELLAE